MKKTWIICVITAFALLAFPSKGHSHRVPSPFVATASTSHTLQEDKMEWFREARLGLFINWGGYTAFAGEWKGRSDYGEFIMLEARIPIREYEPEVRKLNPFRFDADKWVKAAKNMGARYIVYSAKHHDGFAMYHSPCSEYNLCDFTSFHRDPLKELAVACRKHGLKLGIYYSLGRDWHDPDVPTNWPTKGGRSNTWDYPDEDAKDVNRYMERKAKPQIRELLEQYHPDLIWFDTFELTPKAQSQAIRKMILDFDPNIIINDRIGHGLGDFRTVEQRKVNQIIRQDWEACITMSKNWGYMKADNDFKSPQKLIGLLIDMASKGGNLLLNVGPTPEGEFQERNLVRMKRIGQWLQVNGEAIYGSRPWKIYGEDVAAPAAKEKAVGKKGFEDALYDATGTLTQDLRFTVNNNYLYIFAREWKQPDLLVRSLTPDNGRVKSVRLLGCRKKPEWKQTADGLHVILPNRAKNDLDIYTLKVELDSLTSL